MKTLPLFATLSFIVFTAAAPPSQGGEAQVPITAHEWGTFTTVSGSDGKLLPGLEVEEEALPFFVAGFPGLGGFNKGFGEVPILAATVKMETPVIYFYADNREPIAASVKVGFEGGSISQWFPQRSGGEESPVKFAPADPAVPNRLQPLPVDFAQSRHGSAEWEFEILPQGEADPILALKPGEIPAWVHPRGPESNLIRNAADGAVENYIFYRGIGNFEIPVTMSFEGDGVLVLKPEAAIGFALAYEMDESRRCRILWKGELKSGSTARIDASPEAVPFQPEPALRPDLYAAMAGGLREAGLTGEEASAMLRTWWLSYMDRPGVRVFWVAPRAFTDQILPLAIDPAPAELERVIPYRAGSSVPEL
ncbi:MAG: hypothetical protein R3F11_27580 [Verrucomicrobiales bacterium]